jgi:putative methionine-R-sulfoxide reductase with GAF domain
MATRDYDSVIMRLGTPRITTDRTARMQAVVDALWDELSDKGVSWVGFYVKSMGVDELVLGPRRDKPACSPIAMHGACGQAFLNRKPLIVSDVNNLRAGYIACDPRDRSEIVVPCMDAYDDLCWGVLDLDSFDTHAFNERDAVGLTNVLIHMGLHVPQSGLIEAV